MKLPREFYNGGDVVEMAQSLLGKVINVKDGNGISSGKITETEAYCGRDDLACHAFKHGLTPRTAIMFGEGGYSYVYLCYGIHHLFNVVTNVKGLADAVLIRAVEPVDGLDLMEERRGFSADSADITSGPGRLTQALGIGPGHYGQDLCGDTIWIEDRGHKIARSDIQADIRIGVEYAGKDALKPWRFFAKGSKWVSRGLTNKLAANSAPAVKRKKRKA